MELTDNLEEVHFFGNEQRIKSEIEGRCKLVNIDIDAAHSPKTNSNLSVESYGNVSLDKINTSIDDAYAFIKLVRGLDFNLKFAGPYDVIIRIKENKGRILFENKLAEEMFVNNPELGKEYWKLNDFVCRLMCGAKVKYFAELYDNELTDKILAITPEQMHMYNAGVFYLPKINKPAF